MPKRLHLLVMSSLLTVTLLAALLLIGNTGTTQAATAATTVTLFAQADAMADANFPDTNYGAGSLGVAPTNQSYVWFDLSGLPANAVIDSAVLQLMPADIAGQGPHTVGVGRVQARWDESTVTHATKPGVSNPAVSTSVGAYTVQSWPVTAIVQQWHAGTLNNYGFALLGNTAGVWFHSKETGPAPRLVITATLPPDDNPDEPVPPGNPFTDLGDAPDSTNNHGQNNTAYPGTLGQFPTVYQGTAAGQPAGPAHVNATLEAALGDHITREAGADGGADADGINNILRTPAGGVADTADNDRADDGWRNRNVPIVDCQRVSLVVRVRKAPGAQLDRMYLNVFHDGNQDGDWADVGVCQFEGGQQARSYEWIVQDYAVDLSAIPAGSSQNVTVTTVLVHSPKSNAQAQGNVWMRFGLSEQKAPRNPATHLADGRGPHPSDTPKAYAHGETEDILYRPDPKGQPGTLTLQKAVTVPSTPVGYADTVTYTIRLKHTGGTEPVLAEIRDMLSYPQHVLPQVVGFSRPYIVVEERSPGVSPLHARLEYVRTAPDALPNQVVRWKGTLAPDAEVELTFLVHVHPLCGPDQSTTTITNTATLHKPDGTEMDAKSVTFEAVCARHSTDDIQVEQTVITDGDGDQVTAADAAAPQIMFETIVRPRWQGTFTNNANEPVSLAFSLNFEEIKAVAAETAAETAATSPICRVLTLQPGETRTLDVWTDMRPLALAAEAIPDDPAQELAFRSRLRYAVLPPGEAVQCEVINRLPTQLIAEDLHPFQLRPWDVGDAPDSTNHPATAMDAYAGVQANFPTVYDVTTGAPEGPRHARPRPFHLGPRVEFEPDADLGAAPRNIDPTTNTPNRDRYDDGVNLGTVAFQDCQTTTFQTRVYISAAAQAALLEKGIKNAYINSWVDSNRDGNWADAAQCASGPTPEHIVIDQPVDIATLTPGLNTITVTTTGPVAWPGEMVQKPAWLRVMLSEEKSVKLAGLPYGDGRGPASGYRTGETEDYLLRPSGQGADPLLNADVAWNPMPSTETGARANRVALRIGYANNGSEPLVDGSLTITLPTVLANATLLDVISTPDLGLEKRSPLVINLSLGTLEPGQTGTIIYSWKVEEGETAARSTGAVEQLGNFEIQLVGKNPNGVFVHISALRALHIDQIVPTIGFGIPGSPYRAANATTSRDNVEIRGTAAPSATLTLSLLHIGEGGISRSALTHGGWLTATVMVGANGAWSYGLENLVEGLYWARIGNGAPGVARTSALDKASPKMAESFLQVAPDLPIDPLSFVIGDGAGMNWTPETLNFNIGMPPTVFVPGRTYTMQVQQTPNTQNLGLALQFFSPFQTLVFEDLGGGTLGWTNCLTCTRSSNVSTGVGGYALAINNDGEETVLEGTYNTTALGKVNDATTGRPISGAAVRLLAQTEVSDTVNSGSVYVSWDGAGGQANPQTTGADGGYLFVPGEGIYRVEVSAPGYQPYTSDDVAVAAGGAVALDIALTPSVTQAADVTISIGPGGFDPGVLVVPPGTTIRWVNMDVTPHSVVATGFDSGLLNPGTGYMITASQVQSITFRDGTDPFNMGTLVVDPNAPSVGGGKIFLPFIVR